MLDSVKEFLIGSSPLDLAYFTILFISVIQCYINGFVSSLISGQAIFTCTSLAPAS